MFYSVVVLLILCKLFVLCSKDCYFVYLLILFDLSVMLLTVFYLTTVYSQLTQLFVISLLWLGSFEFLLGLGILIYIYYLVVFSIFCY